MDVLITRDPAQGPVNVGRLTVELRARCAKVLAVTAAHHCDPYAIFVHVSEPLTPEERAAVEQVVQAHRATPQSAGA